MHSEHFPDSFHRVTVKGLCVRDGKVLLVRESGYILNDGWELPGGGLDFGEDIKEGLKREIKEEMGLEVTKISGSPVYLWTHRYEPNKRKIGWYYSLVIAYRIELKNLDFKPSPECVEVKFFAKDELEGLKYSGQAEHLVDIFDPKDFKETF